MQTQARTMKGLQAIQVVVRVDSRPVRAILAREALEAVAATPLQGEDAMLAAFSRHQVEIERIVVARCIGSGRKSVILWGAADVAMPAEPECDPPMHRARVSGP